jgi:hypothetical protein
VTITGTNLGGAKEVKFGPNTATVMTDTPTSITVTSPGGTGAVHVTVTTASGTTPTTGKAGGKSRFRYVKPRM